MKRKERILTLAPVVILLLSVSGCIASEQNTGAVEALSTDRCVYYEKGWEYSG